LSKSNHRDGCEDCTNVLRSLKSLVETISKKKVPDHQKKLVLEINAEDAKEEDVDIPYVMVNLP